MDAYLEEDLYDQLTYCIQHPDSAELPSRKQRIAKIGKELYSDGGAGAMENVFFSIEHRIKDEIGGDARPYRSWWNGLSEAWEY